MSNKVHKQIDDEINRYSNGNDRLGELLHNCIGRLCLKSAKAGNDWRKELNSIDVPHITDWLKAAIINEDVWLKNVDNQDRPKKLMKFGSFEDIQKEADKAMLRANQKNCNIKLIEGDEELYMQLEDGYHLVKLLTPAALDREGAQMQHCIGGGAYDHDLNSDEHYFLSLRDGHGKPHATLEVRDCGLEQLQGKQNQAPSIKYIKSLKPFFAKSKLLMDMKIGNFGYVISTEGDAYEIGNLPDGLEVRGSLDLERVPIKSLPKGLKIGGYLDLEGTLVESLPEGLKIGGDLFLRETLIKSLPEGLEVDGNLFLIGKSIKTLPSGLKVGGILDITGTSIKSLPSDIKVEGKIYKPKD